MRWSSRRARRNRSRRHPPSKCRRRNRTPECFQLFQSAIDIRLAVECALHPLPVELFVRLRARRPDRRSPASIEQLELNAGCVDRAAHQPTESITSRQGGLCCAADRRATRHCATVSTASVQIATRAPRRAAAYARTPAWPAPITITSNESHWLNWERRREHTPHCARPRSFCFDSPPVSSRLLFPNAEPREDMSALHYRHAGRRSLQTPYGLLQISEHEFFRQSRRRLRRRLVREAVRHAPAERGRCAARS